MVMYKSTTGIEDERAKGLFSFFRKKKKTGGEPKSNSPDEGMTEVQTKSSIPVSGSEYVTGQTSFQPEAERSFAADPVQKSQDKDAPGKWNDLVSIYEGYTTDREKNERQQVQLKKNKKWAFLLDLALLAADATSILNGVTPKEREKSAMGMYRDEMNRLKNRRVQIDRQDAEKKWVEPLLRRKGSGRFQFGTPKPEKRDKYNILSGQRSLLHQDMDAQIKTINRLVSRGYSIQDALRIARIMK